MSECVPSNPKCIKNLPHSTANFCTVCGTATSVALGTALSTPAIVQQSLVVDQSQSYTQRRSESSEPLNLDSPIGASAASEPIAIPSWAGSDWMPSAITAASVVVGTLLVSAVALLLVSLVTGIISSIPFVQSAALLASAAFGASIKGTFEGYGLFSVGSSGLFLPWILIPPLITIFVSRRFGIVKMTNVNRRRAFVAKTALISAVGSTLVGALAGITAKISTQDFSDIRVTFDPSDGRAFVVTLLTVSIGGALARGRYASTSPQPEQIKNIRRMIPVAIRSYLLLCVACLIGGIGWILVSGNLSGSGMIAMIAMLVVWGGNLAFGISGFVMGVPTALTYENNGTNNSYSSFSDSYHMLSASTDRWVLVLVILAPIAVGVVMWRWLQHNNPTTQKEISRSAATVGLLFGLVAAVLSLFASATTFFSGSGFLFDASMYVKLGSNFGLAFVLGCLWGFIGAFVAAFYWANQRGIKIVTTIDP